MDNVIHFPVGKRMSSRVAEERLGSIVMYRIPEAVEGRAEWLERWLTKKFVLFGWEPVKEGLVKSMKSGRVKHLIAQVSTEDIGRGVRPKVELGCGFDLVPVFNWDSCKEAVKSTPVTVLSIDQSSYFRMCKKCQEWERRIQQMKQS